MGKRKGETRQQWMERIRASRGLPPQTRESLMGQVVAARCYIDRAVTSPKHQGRLEISAFMSIFHPEYSADQVRELFND